MGTMKQAADKDSRRKKLKLNKETVKDLAVSESKGVAVKGAAAGQKTYYCSLMCHSMTCPPFTP